MPAPREAPGNSRLAIEKRRHETPYRELMPPFLRYAKAEHVCLLGSIAVTFGTLGKFFDRRGLSRILRFEVLSLYFRYLNDEDPDELLPRGSVQCLSASNNQANSCAVRPFSTGLAASGYLSCAF